MVEGVWNDNKCDELSAYICEYYLNGSPHPDLPNPPAGGCPSGDWIHYAGMCYKFKLKNGFSGDKYSRQTFDQAEKNCQTLGTDAHLAILPTPFHHAFVTALVDSDVWIGVMSDSEIGKHFQWANSEPLLYSQWRLLHPTHHEAGPNQDKVATVLHPYYKAGDDYAMIPSVSSIYPGDWEDVAGGVTNTQYSVCSIPASSSLANKGSYPDKYKLNCPFGYKPYFSACYKVITSQALSYQEADNFCKSEGKSNNWNINGTAHLASIWNHYEDSFLYSQVFEAFGQELDVPRSIWIGLSVNGDENNPSLVWDDNLPVDYTNWAAHEPGIHQGDNCAFVENFMEFPKKWEWKMTNNCEMRRNFVCKLDKYTITPPDENAPSHLGSPVECENGWTSLDGGLDCFRTFGKEVVYAEARRSCLSFDSSVASIHDLTTNLFVNSLLSTDTSAHLKSAWIGAERTQTGSWRWMDGSIFLFSNFVVENDNEENAVMAVDGRWESQESTAVHGYICSKMKKFENCLATAEIHHCPGSNSGTTEQSCYDLGCCWDTTKTSHCFKASADTRKSSEGHTAGFAAGITAMVFILAYAAVGGVYFFVLRK